ncbi:hypothetical protein GGR58DRAFT_309722 [Xylaria digitata]|nr:hypothetical protein GGR58DRAFT_309722 [Xylaria digitata]
MRGWAACSNHNWAPDISRIKMPLGKLLDFTHSRRCTEERDNILGVLGVALSTERFSSKGISSLDDAYREGVRCGALGALGALGAEVLLADWIPKNSIEAGHPPCMGEKSNALRPMVDSKGRLICKAYEVYVDMEDRLKYSEWTGSHQFKITMRNGTYTGMVVLFTGRISARGKGYMLVAADGTYSLDERILVWASNTKRTRQVSNANRTHRIEGTRIIRSGLAPEIKDGEEERVITLKLA